MNPERLLQNFDRLIDIPDAVPRLRRFILDLAVQGKLVEQNPEDEPATDLLNRVDEELIESPFEIPEKWVSAKAGSLLNIQYGKARPEKDRSHQGSVPVYGSNGIVGYCEEALSEESAIIIGRKGSAGALNLCDGPSWTTDVAYFLIPPSFFNIRFLLTVLQTLDLGSLGKGVKPGLNRGEVYQLPIVAPPLPEQNRIVAKVDELMKLCDEIEAAQAKRERRRDRLVAATLHGLNNGKTANGNDDSLSFEDSVRFYFNHLPRLTTRLEHIQQLRQTILNLAVRGKLVPQDPKDEPVSILLQRVDQERVQIAKEDRRATAELQELLAYKLCWDVPPAWNWRGVADIALFIDYRGKTPTKVTSGIRLITAKNVRRGFINRDPEEFITESTYKSWMTRGLPHEGDILFTTEAPMGNAAVVCLQERFGLAQRVINLRPYAGLHSDFLVLQFLSKPFQIILTETATGLTAKGIKAAKLKRLPLAVPPLDEQHRIVAKVNELMELCSEVEAQITTNTTTSRKLLEAILQEAINGQSSLKRALP